MSHLLYMDLGGSASSSDSAALELCDLVQITTSLALGSHIYNIMQVDSVALKLLWF